MAFFIADKNVFAEKTRRLRSFSDSKLTFLYNEYFVSTQEMPVLYLKLPVEGSATDCPLKSVLKFKTSMGAHIPWWLRRYSICLQCTRPKLGPWRKKWQPASVFSPGKVHGQRSLVGYSPWDRKESGTTEPLHFTHGCPCL